MNTVIKFACTAAIAITSTAGLFSATVHAQTTELSTARVDFADLDLTTAAGQEALSRRIDRAAKQVCGDESDRRYSEARRAFNACYAKAKSQATQQVGGRHGQPLALKSPK